MVSRFDLLLRELHEGELDLAGLLLHVSDRHRTDHEVFHVARDLAQWSSEHVTALADVGRRRGLDLGSDVPHGDTLSARMRQKIAELLGRDDAAGLLLLRDLREVHVHASTVSTDWVMLAQGAQAARDSELLELATSCHPQTLRQLRWALATIKVTAPQVLTSG